jgi:hypothetical protein
MVDGDRIWTSDKLRSIEPEELRFDYANLLPLALANGSFECSPGRVLRDVYFFLRPSVSLEDVEAVLNEYERVRLLFRWRDERSKVWGFWVGITSEGLLPAKAHVDRGDYKKGKEPPADLLQKFINGEIESGLLPNTPCLPPGENQDTTELTPARVGKGRLGEDREGKDENSLYFQEYRQEKEMKIKNEMQKVCADFGIRPGGFKSTWDEMNVLGISHTVGAVVRDFTEFLEENRGDDYPNGAVSAYQRAASARLASEAPAAASLKSPEVVSLVRELVYAADGQLSFVDKQKIRLAEVLKEFSQEEVVSVFKTWLKDQDLTDAKNLSFAPGKFVQVVDSLAYCARWRGEEAKRTAVLREAAVAQLQAQAEEERAESEKKKLAEENIFDPLA